MMTRQDFEIIAMAMRHAKPDHFVSEPKPAALAAWKLAVHELAYALSGTNPRFDKERFIGACNNKRGNQ